MMSVFCMVLSKKSVPGMPAQSCLQERRTTRVALLTHSYEFLWSDKYMYRKPTRLHAKMYIEILMNWIVSLLEDETLFPVDAGSSLSLRVTHSDSLSSRLP